MNHQYIDRATMRVRTERLYGDRLIEWAYQAHSEDPGWLCKALSSARLSKWLGFLNYDLPFANTLSGIQRFVTALGVDLTECLDPPGGLTTPRQIFERKIRYWRSRPMEEDEHAVSSPCDARLLFGSFSRTPVVSIKGKFFELHELLGDRPQWSRAFRDGDYCILRLTPDKYHYNHVPVTGTVADIYEIGGAYHSCNPSAVVMASTYSKNARVVTILDTEAAGGSGTGLVAMIEIVALMIGRIDQCYSESYYDDPQPITRGMRLRKGQPKSLYRPGSSTTVLLFQSDRIRFSEDLVTNLSRPGVQSRFSEGFGRPLVETDVKARSTIARWRRESS